MFAVFLFLTYYLAQIKGFSPLETGFGFIPMILGVMVSATGLAGVVHGTDPNTRCSSAGCSPRQDW